MDRHRHGFCEIQRNILVLRYECCGHARGASDSFALPERLSGNDSGDERATSWVDRLRVKRS
jgi:hypothetical protein